MAKKLVFLLVMMFVLLIASVTALANTGSKTAETGYTQDKANSAKEISVIDLENKYGDLFFDGKATSEKEKEFVSVKYVREADGKNELRYNFTGSVKEDASPLVMLMYIKENDKFVPLTSVETGKNITEGALITCSKVDLKYLGSNKVNEVRIIAFKKSDISKLTESNIQILDLQITVRPWNPIEKAVFKIDDFLNKNGKTSVPDPIPAPALPAP